MKIQVAIRWAVPWAALLILVICATGGVGRAQAQEKAEEKAEAEGWQYCLAPDYEHNKVYVSAREPQNLRIEDAFREALKRRGASFSNVECPIAASERDMAGMQLTAIDYNRRNGATIITVPVR